MLKGIARLWHDCGAGRYGPLDRPPDAVARLADPDCLLGVLEGDLDLPVIDLVPEYGSAVGEYHPKIVSASSARRLWTEADHLAEGLDDVLEKTLRLGLGVIELLADQQAACAHERTRGIYAGAISSHDKFITQMNALAVESDRIQQQCRPSDYTAQVKAIQEKQSRVSIAKLGGDAELSALYTRAQKSIQAMPDTVGIPLASAGICRISLVYSHAEVLTAFLDRPPLGDKALDATAKLVKAVALDTGGSTVFPFLGTLETLLDLATPQIKRDAERMRTARAEWDRLFAFGDQLTTLIQSANLAQENARAADRVIAKAHVDFDRDVRWLSGLLEAADDG